MKAKILSFVIVLIALFSVSSVFAQKDFKANPKISTAKGDPTFDGTLSADGSTYNVCITELRLTGLGDATSVDATFNIAGTATVCCISPGQETKDDPNCTSGQRLSASTTVKDLPVENGNVTITNLCTTLVGACKNAKNFDADLQDVVITSMSVTVQGKTIPLDDYLAQVN